MGTISEDLVRRFNEENNEEAGEHWTPRDAVKLMARLVFLPVAEQIESGTYLIYDGACGTGGMLTVAEETLQTTRALLPRDRGVPRPPHCGTRPFSPGPSSTARSHGQESEDCVRVISDSGLTYPPTPAHSPKLAIRYAFISGLSCL